MSRYLRTPPVLHREVFFGPEEQYTRMSSSLLSATVRRLLIEAMIYSWTLSGDSTNAGMHAHFAAFPYLDVTKISIRQPWLNFAVYSSHMLPHRLNVLLSGPSASALHQGCYYTRLSVCVSDELCQT